MDWDDYGSEKCSTSCMAQDDSTSLLQSNLILSIGLTCGLIVLSFLWLARRGRRNLVTDPQVAQKVLNESSSSMAHKKIHSEWMSRVFGCTLDRIDAKAFLRDWSNSVILSMIMEPGSSNMIKSQDKFIQRKIVNLVTFATSLVDQEQWERAGNTEVVETDDGERIAVTDLSALVKTLIVDVTNCSLIGEPLWEDWAYTSDFLQMFWLFDANVNALGSEFPRWIPRPAVNNGLYARRRLDRCIEQLQGRVEAQLDSGTDTEGISPLFLETHKQYKKHTASSPELARAYDLLLIWYANAKSGNAAFWLLLHILATPDLADRIRSEVAPYIKITRTPPTLGISEPAKIEIDSNALSRHCPLLRGCYIETLRLHARGSMSVRDVLADIEIKQSNGTPLRFSTGERLEVRYASYAGNPREHFGPETFDPTRHFKAVKASSEAEPGIHKAEAIKAEFAEGMSPYGGGASACKGAALAERAICGFVAAALTLWEFEPDGKRGWKVPANGGPGSGIVASPKRDVRVRIRARKTES